MEEPTLRIGPLPVDEWREHKRLRLEALEREPQAFGSNWAAMSQKPDEFWRSRLETSALCELPLVLFAKRGEAVVGMIGAFLEEPGRANVISMYVTASARGAGVGRALMTAILERIAADSSVHTVSLSVNPEQGAALALYASMGFEVVSTSQAAMGDGEEHEQLLMVKRRPL